MAWVTPGSGLIIIEPVSVCHQASTTGVGADALRYQIHASGLIGSPTEPRTRREDRSNFAGMSSPHFMNVRIAVGAVYRIVTPYFCTISQNRPWCGCPAAPRT
ncbi:hypothetical protein STENM327S_08998 [Streptomyces tendae]